MASSEYEKAYVRVLDLPGELGLSLATVKKYLDLAGVQRYRDRRDPRAHVVLRSALETIDWPEGRGRDLPLAPDPGKDADPASGPPGEPDSGSTTARLVAVA